MSIVTSPRAARLRVALLAAVRTSRTWSRCRTWRLTSLAILACVLLIGAAPADAWSVSPALLSTSTGAGTVTRGSFEVTTAGSAGRRFRVVVQDLGETSAGAFTFTRATAATHSAAPWIAVLPRAFIATGRPQPVDYAISVPADATPGDHVAAISVQELPASAAGNLGVVEAIGLRETVRISGSVTPGAKITRLDAPSLTFGGSVPVTATVTNVGNTVLDFDGPNAGSTLGAGDQRTRFTGVLLPGATRTVQMTWTDPPVLGWASERVLIKLAPDRWVSQSRQTLALPPWQLLALVALSMLVLAAWSLRRIARRRRELTPVQ